MLCYLNDCNLYSVEVWAEYQPGEPQLLGQGRLSIKPAFKPRNKVCLLYFDDEILFTANVPNAWFLRPALTDPAGALGIQTFDHERNALVQRYLAEGKEQSL